MTVTETTKQIDADASDLSQVIGFMAEDKSNDWSEEIAVLEDIESQMLATTMTVADLDDTFDAAHWIQSGHVLDDHEVAYIRSLILPAAVAQRTRGTSTKLPTAQTD